MKCDFCINSKEKIRKEARIKSNVQVINSDHMAKKFCVKLARYTKKNFKLCSELKLLPGGHYISKSNECRYFLTTEMFGENTNTISSQFHQILREIVHGGITNIFFTLDNHSTNKNLVVLAYMD